jgi:hypothetical protein
MNSIPLSCRHLRNSRCVVALNALPVVLILLAPKAFWQTILAWTLIGFSLSAWLNAKILLTVFQKYEKKEEEE